MEVLTVLSWFLSTISCTRQMYWITRIGKKENSLSFVAPWDVVQKVVRNFPPKSAVLQCPWNCLESKWKLHASTSLFGNLHQTMTGNESLNTFPEGRNTTVYKSKFGFFQTKYGVMLTLWPGFGGASGCYQDKLKKILSGLNRVKPLDRWLQAALLLWHAATAL